MLRTKIDSVVIGKRFDELVEKKLQIELDIKRELSKKRSKLWNHKLDKEKEYEENMKNFESQKQNELAMLEKAHEEKKKKILLKYLNIRDELTRKKSALSNTFKKDLDTLKAEYDTKLDEKKGHLFEQSHLQVVGFADNLNLDDFLRL